jgi:hypothetical protein
MATLPSLKPRERPGWPRELPCLRCDRLRLARGPGDRLHDKCREGDDETTYRVLTVREEA